MLPFASRSALLPCAALCGGNRALLLVFVDAWASPDRATLQGLEAELGALRTALLVVGEEGLSYVNSRPTAAATELPAALERSALTALRQRYGGARRGPGVVAASLVEPDGRERFKLLRRARRSVPQALLEALQLARQSVDLPARVRGCSNWELTFYSLVGALSLVFSDGTAAEAAAPGALA